MAIETPTWTYKSKGDKQTASEMNELAQAVITNAIELSNTKDDIANLSDDITNFDNRITSIEESETVKKEERNQPNGYAGLDSSGKVPIERIYGATATVTDVAAYELLPATGSNGVIYNVLNTGSQYKWSGSAYIDITDGIDKAKKNETSIFDCSNGTSTKYYSSLSDAINAVPLVYRTSNRIISYLSAEYPQVELIVNKAATVDGSISIYLDGVLRSTISVSAGMTAIQIADKLSDLTYVDYAPWTWTDSGIANKFTLTYGKDNISKKVTSYYYTANSAEQPGLISFNILKEGFATTAVNHQYYGIDDTTWTNLTKWVRIPNQTDLADIRSDLNELETNKLDKLSLSSSIKLDSETNAATSRAVKLVNDKIEQVKDGGLEDGSIELPKLSPTLAAYIGSGGEVTNLADDDDLENTIINDLPVIREKTTKTYNPENYSGIGRVILRKNMVNGVNVLTKDMINQANTIYEIRYDFDLDEQIITIPENCILKFDGGSLNNGTINLNGCYINAGLNQIFNNVKFNNIYTYNNTLEVINNIYIKALSANAFVNKKTNKLVPANTIVNRRYVYKVTNSTTSTSISGNTITVTLNGTTYDVATITSDNKYKLIYNYVHLLGIVNETGEMAFGELDSLSGITFYSINPIIYTNTSIIKNREIYPEWFGAKGDNTNDDSVAFNTVLDLAWYSKNKVVVGSGIYKIDDTIIIHTNTNIQGVVPTVEYPIKGIFSVNTDIAMLVFDRENPNGSYQINNIGFRPFDANYEHNYIGIKIYHSQNHSKLSNIGFVRPIIGIDIDCIGGVQMLRCEDINLWSENRNTIGIAARQKLSGWFNVNYFRFGCLANCAGIKFECGGNNTLDGGAGYTEGTGSYLINLNNATLIVRGSLYKETGNIATLRNNSRLKWCGDSYLIGQIDCDETSTVVYESRNFQGRERIINNRYLYNDCVIKHLTTFKRSPLLWFDTIEHKVVRPIETGNTYHKKKVNGKYWSVGYCKLPGDDIDIANKTVVLRVCLDNVKSLSGVRLYPFKFNADSSPIWDITVAKWYDYVGIIYANGDAFSSPVERGECFVFLPNQKSEFILHNLLTVGNNYMSILDIYIINKPLESINNGEYRRIIDLLESLDNYSEDGYFDGYNKGTFSQAKSLITGLNGGRQPIITSNDIGFEFFATDKGSAGVGAVIYYTGDSTTPWVYADGTTVTID